MGLRCSLPPRQLTSPRLVQRARAQTVTSSAEHAEATVRENVQHIREPGTRLRTNGSEQR
jgi:hypothetical protein